MRHGLRFKLFAVLCILLPAVPIVGGPQSMMFSGPVLGYLWNAGEGQLLPLQGIPGSATIGAPFDLGFAVSSALPLDGHHFLATLKGVEELVLINMKSNPPGIVAIPNAPGMPSVAARSRTGRAFALYDAARQDVHILTGLPAAPKTSNTVGVSFSGGELTRMAVSDDGGLLVYSARVRGDDSVYSWTSTAGSRLLTIAGTVTAIALAENGDAIVADAQGNEIFSILNPGGSGIRKFMASEKDGISDPVGIAVLDNNQIYVANAGTGTITALDVTGHPLSTQECGCPLSGLYPVDDSVYRLTERPDRTIYLLEAGAAGIQISFVPALRRSRL